MCNKLNWVDRKLTEEFGYHDGTTMNIMRSFVRSFRECNIVKLIFRKSAGLSVVDFTGWGIHLNGTTGFSL